MDLCWLRRVILGTQPEINRGPCPLQEPGDGKHWTADRGSERGEQLEIVFHMTCSEALTHRAESEEFIFYWRWGCPGWVDVGVFACVYMSVNPIVFSALTASIHKCMIGKDMRADIKVKINNVTNTSVLHTQVRWTKGQHYNSRQGRGSCYLHTPLLSVQRLQATNTHNNDPHQTKMKPLWILAYL